MGIRLFISGESTLTGPYPIEALWDYSLRECCPRLELGSRLPMQ